ncbi:hypothetical protein GlitD10_1670 [Gloeomargarita lithophora Alchichica-D10]|uniref:Uncharacterized protein n=1 Tax=Gloeomargarita lithophora Alchichica-D10 TaxID=1188229 RepID=A0A1J0ADK9_9CYAN|nr:hypothetical protein [Gloeomargarita lithophora]APB33995.1 hypothetical protein GlitD10_1670 [Gloeomargarita lithophora Alchichica-D10]
MNQLEIIAKQIAELDHESYSRLRDWFIEFDQSVWDKKIESDSNAGKLDFLISTALAEYHQGKAKDL